jgi:hypothetical protein
MMMMMVAVVMEAGRDGDIDGDGDALRNLLATDPSS